MYACFYCSANITSKHVISVYVHVMAISAMAWGSYLELFLLL